MFDLIDLIITFGAVNTVHGLFVKTSASKIKDFGKRSA